MEQCSVKQFEKGNSLRNGEEKKHQQTIKDED